MRLLALCGAGALVVLLFVPPLWGDASRYEYVETIQFCIAAFAVPALVVVAHPLRRIGGVLGAALERWEHSRRRHPSRARSFGYLFVDASLIVVWRTPGLMDALARHRWVVVLEVVMLVAAGLGLWLELLACPPVTPHLARPWRAVLAALCMWATWVIAYIVGFAHVSWYRAYHTTGGLSGSADQEIASGILLAAAICAFVPVIFADVMLWLKNGEDPDAELHRLVRDSRRRGPA